MGTVAAGDWAKLTGKVRPVERPVQEGTIGPAVRAGR